MDTYFEIVNLIFDYLIKGIFISVFVIVFVRSFFKKIDTQMAIRIVQWMMIAYSMSVLFWLIISSTRVNSSSDFSERATGPYWFAYWLMALSGLLPILFFIKKLSRKVYFILFVSVFINIGWLFESFVIHVTSMHRDYDIKGINPWLPSVAEWFLILRGLLVGVVALVIGNIIHKVEMHKST